MLKRSSGILLHVSSLPSSGGIGDFGPAAYDFVDFLVSAKQTFWQVLPLNPTENIYGNCPYSSNSAFALNPLFISLDALIKDGLIKKEELLTLPHAKREDRVDYLSISQVKTQLLNNAYQRFKDSSKEKGDFEKFCATHAFWLESYADFVAIKARFQGKIWSDWPDDLKFRREPILKELRAKCKDDVKRVKFLQYTAYKQWKALKAYAQAKGISLIGDIPIYVNEDSADVWSHPELFKLDENLKPVVVAGVPPDYFSETGQRWGNPVYDWAKLKETAYDWWLKRIKHNLELYSLVRIDHFRGLLGFWEIPAGDETAVNGHWEKGPGEDFLSALKARWPELPVIAEDLGLITEDVTQAMHAFNLPGMKVLQFGFGGDPRHPYLPENFTENYLVYTGTHDNNTTRGWFRKNIAEHERNFLQHYLKKEVKEEEIAWDLIGLSMRSGAVLSMTPMQDFLSLDEKNRMNVPGTVYENWEWRLRPQDLSPALAGQIASLTQETQR